MTLTSDRKLTGCPATPNCVCSDDGDPRHAIRALDIRGDAAAAWQALVDHLERERGYTIVEKRADYLHAEARTRWLRFVDDVEFQLRSDAGRIAMRSASRVGYSDLGTNRRRLERLRRSLAAQGVIEGAL